MRVGGRPTSEQADAVLGDREDVLRLERLLMNAELARAAKVDADEPADDPSYDDFGGDSGGFDDTI